ncbi:unnamed protein product, partial [Brassica oleracea var. botrytis]
MLTLMGAGSPWLKKSQAGPSKPVIEIVGGVASIQISENIFDESELLWNSFVVGYFIGDSPHMGSVHATVNRIWSSPKAGSKIDVQFTEKNTVLFRIDNNQMRTREGIEREIAVSFPWLPPRCTVCRRWGHKGQDCSGKDIILLKKAVGGENTKSVGVPSDIVKESGNEDLEAITPIPTRAEDAEHTTRQESSGDHRLQAREESHGIQLIEPTTESFHASDSGKWESGHEGKKWADLRGTLSMKRAQTTHTEDEERIAISPSRFSPLQDIEEEGEEEMETMTKEVEEGEICEGTQNQRPPVPNGKRSGLAGKQVRGKVVRTKDLLYMGKQGSTKKSFRVQEGNFARCLNAALPNWNSLANYEYHPLGRIWFCWTNDVVATKLHMSAQVITCAIQIPNTGEQFICSAVYAFNTTGERLALWEELRGTPAEYGHLNLPWVIMGDFNATLASSEHSR